MKIVLSVFNYFNRELFIIFLAILLLIIFIPIFTYLYFANDLTDKTSIMNKNNTGVVLLDDRGQPFFTFYQANYKKLVPLSKISENMKNAVIASEDKNFYNHSGFSFKSIIRAFYLNFTNKNQVYGGSTLTQQLVKNVLLNSKKNITRKIQEVVLAQEIERKYSKNEILEMYLNSVYFGQGAFGVENAANNYFNKNASDLDLNESAFLTAALPSPSSFSPYSGNMQDIIKRKNIILQKMYDQKYISENQYTIAANSKLKFQKNNIGINETAPHFALKVKDELIKKYGEKFLAGSGFYVKTSLNLKWQKIAERVVAGQVSKLKLNHVSNGAAVVIDPFDGQIKAMVGSANWYDEKNGKMNLATIPRSMGSSFKPIIYSLALQEKLINSKTILHDSPVTFPGGYKPVDYDRKFRGNVTIRRALANSLNVPAVEVMQKVGLEKALNFARKLGITSLKDQSNYGLSLVLGAGEVSLLEMTNVYAVFANQGLKNSPVDIIEIYNKQGVKIYSNTPAPVSVMRPEVASQITSILSDNKARAEEFGNLLTISHPAAVKTGTAEDWRDSLTLGYTPKLVVGVWVGNNDNSSMDGIAGSLGAAPIWKSLMETLP